PVSSQASVLVSSTSKRSETAPDYLPWLFPYSLLQVLLFVRRGLPPIQLPLEAALTIRQKTGSAAASEHTSIKAV
ncbi:hypothetical protein ACQP3F_30505, partial [Escherichia coli]